MSFEDTLRLMVREELQTIIRKEVLPRLTAPSTLADDGYLSVEKAAELAEVHGDTIRNWVKAGRLPEHRAGRELRVRRDELHRFLDAATPANTNRATVEEEAAGILARRSK